MKTDVDVEEVWKEFWVPIFGQATEEGVSFEEQVKRELFDYHHLIEGLPVLYDEITGGRCSKPNTKLSVVAELVNERIEAVRQEGYEEGQGDGYYDGRADGSADAGCEACR